MSYHLEGPPDAGHFTHIERTDHVARLALEWSIPDK
jgi:hypothetical protein